MTQGKGCPKQGSLEGMPTQKRGSENKGFGFRGNSQDEPQTDVIFAVKASTLKHPQVEVVESNHCILLRLSSQMNDYRTRITGGIPKAQAAYAHKRHILL